MLQQKNGNNWALTQVGSRFLSDTESRYAIIELELLAVSWAITKCKLFLSGLLHFTVVTDHHPLVPILNHYRLDVIENPRLQHLKSRIMGYNFIAQRIKGALNNAPDALSRNPISDCLSQELMVDFDPHNNPKSSIATADSATSTSYVYKTSTSMLTPIRSTNITSAMAFQTTATNSLSSTGDIGTFAAN